MVNCEHGKDRSDRPGLRDDDDDDDDDDAVGVGGLHHVAYVDLLQSETSGNRCDDSGVAELQVGAVDRALVGFDGPST